MKDFTSRGVFDDPNWRAVRIGDVAETTSGGTPPRGNQHYFGGSIQWFKSGELNDGLLGESQERLTQAGLEVSSAKLFPSGTLLMAMYGATVGRLGISSREATTNQAVCAIYPREGVHVDFLFHFLLWKRPQLIDMSFGGAQPNISQQVIRNLELHLPPIDEQRRLSARLNEQIAQVKRARAAAEAQNEDLNNFVLTALRQILAAHNATMRPVGEVLRETKRGVGQGWADFPVYGATRAGLALAKEPVGKTPWRYKPVTAGTIFYNPMRILLGSIAMLAEDKAPGITSPDYVVLKALSGVMEPLWFYEWLRSVDGAQFILSLARGAVRERMLFNRLAQGSIPVPPLTAQLQFCRIAREARAAQRCVAQQLKALAALPTAYLREAFAGAV